MAYRVPYDKLTEAQKIKIERDLCLKEVTINYGNVKKPKGVGKEIRFFLPDPHTRTVLLPMYYASEVFGKPIINRSKSYPKVPPFEMNGPPRDYQIEVIDQSLKNFMTRGTTFLNVFCSFGKTWVAAKFASIFSKQYGMATLVTYPLTMIGKSWIGTFRNATTAKIYVVGEDQGPPDDDVQIFLTMDTMLVNIPENIRRRIGHFVVDEADCYCTPGRKDGLLSYEPMFITVLTATYERDDGFHKMLDLMVGPERIVRISDKPFFVFQKVTPYTVEPKVGPRGVIFDSIVKELDGIEARNSEILQLVLENPQEKILILTKHVDHATKLTEWLRYYFQGTPRTVSLLAGKMRSYEDANVIVGTISKVGRGYDEKESCIDWKGVRLNMLILVSSTKKPEQIMGRVLRSDIPVIVDLVDDNPNIKKHWSIRRNWYESRNGQIYHPSTSLCWADLRDHLMQRYLASKSKTPTPNQPKLPEPPGVVSMSTIDQERTQAESSLVQSHAAKLAQQMAKQGNFTSLVKIPVTQTTPQNTVVARPVQESKSRSTIQETPPVTFTPTLVTTPNPSPSRSTSSSSPSTNSVDSHASRLIQKMKAQGSSVQSKSQLHTTLTLTPAPVSTSSPVTSPTTVITPSPVPANHSSIKPSGTTLTNPIQMEYLTVGPALPKRQSPAPNIPQSNPVNNIKHSGGPIIVPLDKLEDPVAKAHLAKIMQQYKRN